MHIEHKISDQYYSNFTHTYKFLIKTKLQQIQIPNAHLEMCSLVAMK